MSEDPDYEADTKATPERVIASLLAITWVVLAYRIFGLPIAVRAGLLFMFSLTFIWIPEWMTQFTQTGAGSLRIVGWLLILGIPGTCLAAYWAMR